jgi:hypothetical protein
VVLLFLLRRKEDLFVMISAVSDTDLSAMKSILPLIALPVFLGSAVTAFP